MGKRILGVMGMIVIIIAFAIGLNLYFTNRFGHSLFGYLNWFELNTSTININFTNFIIATFLILVAAITGQIFAFLFAKTTKKAVHSFFDSRWLPKGKRIVKYTTKPGERLECVRPKSFQATVQWELMTKNIPMTFLVTIAIGILINVIFSFIELPGYLATVLGAWGYCFIALPWPYWLKSWIADRTLFIVFTTIVYYIGIGTPFTALITGKGSAPKVSDTPIETIKDVPYSSDPQEYMPEYKTSWLRDQWTAYLSDKTGVATVFLRSVFEKAEDIVMWVDNAQGLVHVIKSLLPTTGAILGNDTTIENDKTQSDIRLKNYPGGVTYNLFQVVDPGLYDEQGDPINQADTQVKEYDQQQKALLSTKSINKPEPVQEQPKQNKNSGKLPFDQIHK